MRAGRLKFQGYKDFPILISRQSPPVGCEVIIPSVGELSRALRLPIRPDEIQQALALAAQATKGYATRGLIEDGKWDPIRDIGVRLFSALFEGARMTAFQRSQDMSSREGVSLRLRLYIDDPNLTEYPWEFMHDGANFLGLSPRFSIVRTISRKDQLVSLPIQPPLSILLVAPGYSNQYIGEMLEPLVARLNELKKEIPLSLLVLRNATPIEIEKALQAQPVHIVHFFCKMVETRNEENALLLSDEKGRDVIVGGERMRHLLMDHHALRLVYLGVPHSDRLAGMMANDISAVIGIRGDATDLAISVFTEDLYQSLLAGQSLEEAVMQARQAIDRRLPGSREWGLPILYLQTPDSVFLPERQDLNITVDQTIGTVEAGTAVTGAVIEKLENVDPEQAREWKKLQAWLKVQRTNLEALEQQQAALGQSAPPKLRSVIDFTNKDIEDAMKRLDQLQEKTKS